jgi:ligand-binding sensor domain-containing protein
MDSLKGQRDLIFIVNQMAPEKGEHHEKAKWAECRFFFMVLLFAGCPFLHADQHTMLFEKVLDLKQQLDGAFLKDREGFIWMGSTGGLFRYDSHEVKVFKAGPNGLSGNWIMAMVEDKEGFLWIGTYSAGITRYDKNTNTFTGRYRSWYDLGPVGAYLSAI